MGKINRQASFQKNNEFFKMTPSLIKPSEQLLDLLIISFTDKLKSVHK
jgi:hypothetical protein